MKDTEIFEGKNLKDVLKDIHDNAIAKRETIETVIKTLAAKINNADDAAIIAPLLKEFYEVSVKNDEQLIKVATIVQRIMTAESYQRAGQFGVEEFMSEDEKDRLIKSAMAELENQTNDVEQSFHVVSEKINDHKTYS